jgi:N-acetyl-anhydromuramyl-L-alanine amidase AmpD
MTKHPVPKTTIVPFNDFFNEVHPKSQIYLHHTASGGNARNVWNWWNSDKVTVGTCVVIAKDGEITQGFSSKFWAHHLGLANKHFGVYGLPYKNLDKTSIGIEITNWGQLTKKGDKFFNYVNGEVPSKDVCTLSTPYKGFIHFEEYTDAQIESVKQLLLFWNQTYNIPLTYNEDIWDVTHRALKGEKGVFTHNSVRKDKIDIYPSPKMIAMLKSLS